jgi:hypothetical protein
MEYHLFDVHKQQQQQQHRGTQNYQVLTEENLKFAWRFRTMHA